MHLSQSALAVNLGIAGSPFSEDVVEKMCKAGIRRAEFPLTKSFIAYDSEAAIREAASKLQDAGIEVWSCHPMFGGQWDISQLDEQKRRHAVELYVNTFPATVALGATLTVIHPSAEPIPDEERFARMEQTRKSLREMAEAASTMRLRLAVEILPRTCLGRTTDEILALLYDLPTEVGGVCLDVNHANLREDLTCTVRTLGNRLLTLHISDNDGVDERHWLPGRGIIRWTEFIRALEAACYTGAFVYETGTEKGKELECLMQIKENFANLLHQAHQKG